MVQRDEYSYWYDAATGGNLVGEGDEIDVILQLLLLTMLKRCYCRSF